VGGAQPLSGLVDHAGAGQRIGFGDEDGRVVARVDDDGRRDHGLPPTPQVGRSLGEGERLEVGGSRGQRPPGRP
jgi:hypothetical protein